MAFGHDLSRWPLVLSAASGTPTLADTQAFMQAWSGWLAREEPFASLRVFADMAALEHPPGSAQEAKAWLAREGEAVRRLVMGMATVVPEAACERMRKMNVEKLFGVPAAVFPSLSQALAWLRERVYAPRALVLDEAGMAAAAAALVAGLADADQPPGGGSSKAGGSRGS